MPRDFSYRARRASRTMSRTRAIGWRWFAMGALVGAGAIGLAWYTLGSRSCPEPAATVQQGTTVQSASAGREPSNAAPPPVFTYPQILAKQEVVVPDSETPRTAPPSKISSAGDTRDAGAAASTDGSLVLQVAALRTAAEADALRAKLAALGLQAEVQVAKINNETFHRVRLGPYSSYDKLREAQGRLKAAGYASVVLRQKPQ
jgi:cell division protein FtsN